MPKSILRIRPKISKFFPIKKIELSGILFPIFAVALFILLSPIVLRHLPDRNWDAASTHWYSSEALFKNWYELDWMGAGVGTWNFPLLSLVLGQISRMSGNGEILFAFTVGIVIITFFLVSKIFAKAISSRTGTIFVLSTSFLSLLSPYWIAELGTALMNWVTVPVILLGILFLMRSIDSSFSVNFLIISGVFFGMAFALKLTNIIYVVTAFVCLSYFAFINSRNLRVTLSKIFYHCAGVLLGILPIIPWWIYVYSKTRNPFFPYYNSIFKSPYYPVESFRDSRWNWKFPDSILNLPSGWSYGSYVAELKAVDARVSVLFLTYACLLLFKVLIVMFSTRFVTKVRNVSPKNKQFVFLHMWIVLSTGIWIIQFGYIRYWIPTEILIGIGIGLIIFEFVQSQILRSIASVLILSVNITNLNTVNWTEASSTPKMGSFSEPWGSPLSGKFGNLRGIVLTLGSPVSFIRLAGPNISHLVNLDLPNIPEKYRLIILDALSSKEAITLVLANQSSNINSIKEIMQTTLGINFELSIKCKEVVGPISVNYSICKVSS